MELVLIALIAALASIPFVIGGRRWRVALPFAAGGLALSGGVLASGEEEVEPTPQRPVEARDEGYVSSDTCRACHPSEHASWRGTFHRTMTQVASTRTLAADLSEPQEVVMWGQRYRFERRGDRVWVDMPDPSSPLSTPDRRLPPEHAERAPRIERPVELVTGSHHYQVLWVPASDHPDTRDLINVRVVYLIEERRWIPRPAAFLQPPHLGQSVVPWRLSCIKCHATRGRPGVDRDTDVVEFGISCEACHGPGEDHVRANRDPIARYARHLTGARDETIVNPANLDHERASHVCAQCHSLLSIPDSKDYIAHGTRFRPGQDIAETFPNLKGELMNEAKRAARIWGDGDVRVTGGEWVGMSEARCFTEGELACTSCHSMHGSDPDDQLSAAARGDAVCTSCHDAGAYETTAHTHHAPDSPGSACYNCHMPHTSYGLLKAVRSHKVDSPSLARSEQSRRPNACNLCHLDRTLAWTAEQLTRLYGQPAHPIEPERAEIAEGLRLLLRGDAGQRALVAWAMGWGPARAASGDAWMAPFLTLTLNDPYDAVRQVGFRSLRTLPGFQGIEFDPLGPPHVRVEQASEFIPRWFEQNGERLGEFPGSLLLDPARGLKMQRITELVHARDNRSVVLSE